MSHTIHDDGDARIRAIAEEIERQNPGLPREEAYRRAALSPVGRLLGQRSGHAMSAKEANHAKAGRSSGGVEEHERWREGGDDE